MGCKGTMQVTNPSPMGGNAISLERDNSRSVLTAHQPVSAVLNKPRMMPKCKPSSSWGRALTVSVTVTATVTLTVGGYGWLLTSKRN